jgi:hypothetical protein
MPDLSERVKRVEKVIVNSEAQDDIKPLAEAREIVD